ncbi:Pre-mRNA-splicing factor of RES complex family protein [Acanthocheilonema viteae]
MDDAAKKARDEYLKKYLSKDNKQSTKKHKKKNRIGIGLKIRENDAFADVAPCTEQASDDESDKDIKILEKVEKLHSVPKFKPAAFEAVELKTETDTLRKRNDSSSDENVMPDEISLPTTSSKVWKSVSVTDKDCSVHQKIIAQTRADSDISFSIHRVKDEPLDSDTSPSRGLANCARRNCNNNKDHLFSKRKKSTNDLDLNVSPPCRRIKDEPIDSDLSPPRRSMHSIKRNSNDDDSDVSPPRRRKRTDNSDSDLSPPRKYNDYGHQKRRRDNIVGSSRHKKSSWDSDSDGSSYDKSVGRRRKHYERGQHENSSRRHRRHNDYQGRKDSPDGSRASHHSKCDRLNDSNVKPVIGKSAGLKTLESHREEMKQLQENEMKLLKSWDGYTSGTDVAVTRRAKLSGKKRETKEDRERKEREAKKQQELEEKYKSWNKGLRQLKERTEKLNEMARVAQEDFARHVDDRAMNEHLKEQLHEKDPMYKYVKKKKENAEMKSGTAYPKYKGSWPPNRFNIAPGYRWDGVNRSNGFEDRIAEVSNRKIAQQTEYYENIVKYEV